MVLFLGDSCGEDKDDAADGGHALFTLFLTLSEAETLRWAMHRNPKAFNKSAATLLRCKHLTPTEQSGSDALSWDRLCYSWNSLLLSKDQISDKIQQRELSQILCCTKVFDSYMYVNPAETALLLRSLCAAGARKSEEGGAVSSERARVMLEERQQFFKCLVSSRRRSGHFEETPFSEVLSCVDFLEKKRKVENAETIRKAFQSAVSIDQLEASYCRYDTDQNGRLDHDELTLAIKHVCRADKSLAQSPELGDLNLVIRDTISVLDKKNTQSITFRQFTSFFFEGADITSSETQASEKMRKGPARRRCVSTRKQESKWSSKQQSADLPNFDQSPPVSIVIALARVPAHILFREVHLIGQLQPACMNKLPSALGSKWKDVGTQKPAKGQEITNEALAAKLQQQLEFTNEEWDNFKVSTLSDDSYIKAGDKYFKSAGGMRRKSASGMLMEPSLLVQAGCTVSTEASVPVTFVPKSVCIESGTFFYEVEIVTSSSAASLRVGWTDASFVGGELACGEPGSWAVTGKRPDAEADDVGADEDSSALQEHLQFFGVQCTPGSVIGCLVSVGEGEPYRTCTFRYCLSGQWDPPAGILVEKGQARIGVTPTLTISPGCKVRVNLGDRPFRFPNARVQQAASVFDWILAKQTFYLKQAAGALFGQCQAACGQSSVLVGAKSIANGMDLQTTTSQCFLVEPDWADWDFGKVTIKVAGFLQARGKWFYEVVLPSYPQLYVGWAGPAFVPKITNNVGQSQSSWAFKVCSWEPQLLHANRNTLSRKTREYKEIKRLLRQEGAIIGCAMDFDRGTMRFYFQWPKSHECKDLGIAFQGIQINGGLFPAVSAYSWENYSVCLGSSQCSNPPGWLAEYSPVANFFQPDSAADKSTGGRSINSSLQMTSDKQQLKLRVTSVQASWLVVEEARGQADQSLSDLTPLTVRGLYGYPSAKLDQVSLDSGAWYYEVTVLEKHERHPASVLSEDGVRTDEVEEDFDADESEAWQTYLPSVGWSDSSFIGSAELGIGLGQDRFSYGHCGLASDDADGTHRHYCVGRNNSRCWVGVTETRGTYKRMGCEWQVNDVVGCVLDCSERKIVFVHHRGAQEEPCIKIFQDIHLSGGMSPTITVPPMFKFALDFGSDTLSPGFEARMKGIKDIKDIGTIQHLRPVFNQGSRIRKKTPAMGSGSKKAGARGHAETRTDMDSQRNILELSFDNLDEFSKLDIHQHDDASHTKIQPDKIQSWYTTRICFNSMPGLSWKAVGPEKPSTGTEIVNESLAAALKQRIDGSLAVAQKQKVDFRREDYGTWHVAKLPHDSYIKAGNRYFVVSINNYDAYSDLQFKLEKMKDAFQIFSKTRVAKSLVCLEIVGAVPMLGNKDDIDPAVMRNLDDALQAALMASRSCLKELRCVACNMSWDGWGVRALAAVLDEHECLEMLELVSCELKQNGARALGEALQFASSLKQLKVQFALLDGVSVRHVILPLNPEHSLSSLDLSHNVIGISAAPTLCTLLRSYPALQSLILAHNGLGSASEALAQELAYNGTLTWLDISHNQIRNKGATAITEALRSNRTLKHLNVSKNNIFEDGMAKFETLFSDSAHPIREFVFWEDSVPEKTLIDLLFSLNRKPMHLIQFGNLVTLKGEIDWKCFFYRPLCFAVWCQWVVTAGLEIASGLKWKEVGVTKSTRIGRSERCLCNLPLADALTRKMEFTSEEWNSFGIRDLRYYDFIEAGGSYFKPAKPALTVPADADTMISNELIEQLILHRISSGMNKDLKAPMHVRRCDARDALRLAICMLRPTRAADGLGDSAWIIDQMLGRDGRLGIVLGTKQNFIATEPNYVFDRRTESYWNRSEDATYSGRQVQVQEAEYLIDLWSIGEHTFMYETGASMEYNHVFSGLIDQSFPWATGKHTALTLAVSHPWEVERDHRVAQRLLRRNRYHKCVLLDKNSESSYDYIIRDRVMHDPDDIGNPNLERNLRVFEAYPDLCNINARREWGVSVKLSALGLAVLHGMGEIVSILLRQNAMQHWEFRDCSSSEIDESLSYEVETEACGQKDIEHVWNHSPIIDRDTGLSFLSLVAQAEPGSLAHMLEFAKGLVVHCPNLISVPDKKGRLPIHYCAVKGHSQLLRLMLRACSSRERVFTILNKLDDDGFTALSLAVIHGQVEIIRLLLKHGAQVVPLKEAQPNLNSHAFELCLLQNIFLHREIERVSNAAHSNLKEKEVEPEPEKSSNIIKWMKNRFASRRISPAPLPRLSVPSVDRDGTHYFAKLDTDGDGQITRKEYDAGFDVLDTDDDGFITKEEFSRVSRAPFDMLDKDGDGKISMAEWKVGFLFFDTNMDGYISTNEFNAETGTEGLRNLQLAFKKSETQIQPIINESGEKVSATRNRFICGVLVRRILVYIFILGFLTVVAFCHSGQLGPHRNGFTLFRAWVKDKIMHESLTEGEEKYFADITNDGDFWEWVSADVVNPTLKCRRIHQPSYV
jgi:ankyrin repeat protein/Ca2+-binding EF-hand superfamily protein